MKFIVGAVQRAPAVQVVLAQHHVGVFGGKSPNAVRHEPRSSRLKVHALFRGLQTQEYAHFNVGPGLTSSWSESHNVDCQATNSPIFPRFWKPLLANSDSTTPYLIGSFDANCLKPAMRARHLLCVGGQRVGCPLVTYNLRKIPALPAVFRDFRCPWTTILGNHDCVEANSL